MGESKEMSSGKSVGQRLTPLQEKFIQSGVKGLKECEIISLLLLGPDLSSAECRKLTKQVIERFKTLRQVVAASPEELRQAGVPPPWYSSYQVCTRNSRRGSQGEDY